MRKRKSTVELVFGCTKGAKGFRQCVLRGIEKVRGEWAPECIAYNIRKLHIPNPAQGGRPLGRARLVVTQDGSVPVAT